MSMICPFCIRNNLYSIFIAIIRSITLKAQQLRIFTINPFFSCWPPPTVQESFSLEAIDKHHRSLILLPTPDNIID